MNLSNQLLIAMPSLDDPWFNQSVTYIFEHTEEGTSGIVLSDPIDMSLDQVLEQLALPVPSGTMERQVMRGGPVEAERGFVLHRGAADYDASAAISDEVALTTSRDLLEAISRGEGPEQMLLALGRAGWAGGQLEQEIAANSWLTAPTELSILFDLPPAQRWQAAVALLGIDPAQLSPDAGHA
ncbi:MAG: YqgE/AlgH family protein [Granulosicoccaceae bacterium]